MRSCPSCQATLSAQATHCDACGAEVAPTGTPSGAFAVGDTMQQRMSAVSPSPVVRRSAGTPGRGSQPGAATAAARATAPNFDSIVGACLAERYEVTRKVGEGGMGAVYEARHMLIGKRVAIKVLLDKYAEKPDVVARLQQEARLASSIGHENIVDITDFGTTEDGRTFVVMEFLEGESLAQVIEREGALAPQRAVAIVRQVASALGAAHEKGVVHRDVKPENVFITLRNERDYVKVVDFGISKSMKPGEHEAGVDTSPRLTQTGMVLGTPLYMSPEQARGEDDLDHRIDVYALGVILYEMLTGEVPFHGTNYLNIIAQVLSAETPRPSQVRPDLGISAALESVVYKAMSKDRKQRYQSMGELDADLAKIEAGVAVRVHTGKAQAVPPRRQLAQLAIWGGAVAAVVIAVAVVIPKVLGGETAPREQPMAVQLPPPPPVEVVKKLTLVKVSVTSTPPGAHIWHGQVEKGITPKELEFPLGETLITLTLKLDGYEDASAPFYPTAEQPVLVTLTEKKAPPPPPVPPIVIKDTGKKPPQVVPPKVPVTSSAPAIDMTGGDIHPNPYPTPKTGN